MQRLGWALRVLLPISSVLTAAMGPALPGAGAPCPPAASPELISSEGSRGQR